VVIQNKDAIVDNYTKSAFKRGVMQFEDYNYNQHNSYILVDGEDYKDAETEKPQLPSKMKAPLTHLALDNAFLQDYEHNSIMSSN